MKKKISALRQRFADLRDAYFSGEIGQTIGIERTRPTLLPVIGKESAA